MKIQRMMGELFRIYRMKIKVAEVIDMDEESSDESTGFEMPTKPTRAMKGKPKD